MTLRGDFKVTFVLFQKLRYLELRYAMLSEDCAMLSVYGGLSCRLIGDMFTNRKSHVV